MNDSNKSIDIENGTMSFQIKENQINFDDNLLYTLVNISIEKGSIFILKDTDKKIKFFYVYLGKGRTDIEWDCSKLKKYKKHMIAITWSQKDKEVKLYIDGQLVKFSKIEN